MYALNCTYILKKESVVPSKRYLGDNVEKFQMCNGKECCPIYSVDFPQGSIHKVYEILSNNPGVCIKKCGKGEVHTYRIGLSWI